MVPIHAHSSLQRLQKTVVVWTLLSVALFSAVTGTISTVHAAPPGSTVLIATDATSTSACSVTYNINIGWHGTPPPGARPLVPWIKTLPCPAGTIIMTSAVPLSQVLAQHERYVPLPANPKAPTTAERAAIQALMDAKKQTFASVQSTAVPLSGKCNASNASLQWSRDNVGHFSQVWWYRTCDGTQVYMDQTYASTGFYGGYPTNYWYWYADEYISNSYYVDREEAPYSGYTMTTPSWFNPLPSLHWYRQYWYEWLIPAYYDVSIAVLN